VVIVLESIRAAHTKAGAYQVLCDLLDARFAHGRFVPVLPLDRDQAYAIASSPVDLADVAEQAVGLMDIAAHHPTPDGARTLLSDIDELITRRVGDTND
jgi:hypothetical protein